MAEPFLGEIRMFAMGFAPKDWALCDGQLLPVYQHKALFSLLGTTFGGDYRSINFALPDMRGRVPVGESSGSWDNVYKRGNKDGVETVTLQSAQMPAHTHSLYGTQTRATDSKAGKDADCVFAATKDPAYAIPGTELITLNEDTCTHIGGGASHNNMQPSLVINFAISLKGPLSERD